MNDPASTTASHRRIQQLSKLMDTSIRLPGGYRVGWDGVIGLIPGIGDAIGASVSLYIIFVAQRSGASVTTLLRMLGNVALETLVGLVPVLGDLFDFVFKANTRNLALLNAQVGDPGGLHRTNRLWLWAGILGVLAVIALTLYLSIALVSGLWRLVS